MAEKTKNVRVLVAVAVEGIEYPANTALALPAKLADVLVKAGQADDTAEAVDYALTQGELVVHQKPVEAEPGADSQVAAE